MLLPGSRHSSVLATGSEDRQSIQGSVSSALCVYEISNVSIYNINIMGEEELAWKCKGFSYSLLQRRVKKSTE